MPVPYAPAGVTEDGRRATATCPECGDVFVGATDDDEGNKQAVAAYAEHYAEKHDARPGKAATRQYVIGLPVVITVGTDGAVTVDVDMSEAADTRLLSDGMPAPEDAADPDLEFGQPGFSATPEGAYSEEVVDGDAALITEALDLGRWRYGEPVAHAPAKQALAELDAAERPGSGQPYADADLNSHTHPDSRSGGVLIHSHARGDMAHDHGTFVAVDDLALTGRTVVAVLSLAPADCVDDGVPLTAQDVEEGLRARLDEFYPHDSGRPVSPTVHKVVVV